MDENLQREQRWILWLVSPRIAFLSSLRVELRPHLGNPEFLMMLSVNHAHERSRALAFGVACSPEPEDELSVDTLRRPGETQDPITILRPDTESILQVMTEEVAEMVTSSTWLSDRYHRLEVIR